MLTSLTVLAHAATNLYERGRTVQEHKKITPQNPHDFLSSNISLSSQKKCACLSREKFKPVVSSHEQKRLGAANCGTTSSLKTTAGAALRTPLTRALTLRTERGRAPSGDRGREDASLLAQEESFQAFGPRLPPDAALVGNAGCWSTHQAPAPSFDRSALTGWKNARLTVLLPFTCHQPINGEFSSSLLS